MRVLSLFDGMACGHIALTNAGVEIDEYYAYEIDKQAIKTATHNFPDIIEMGDVFVADFTKYSGIDWLVGGSPCVYWSVAQTKNREITASGLGWDLFSQYNRALREANPKFFIYENNKSMSDEIRRCISETFGFDPICINSALVSAQNRQRLYWVGIRNEDGTYRKANIHQPEDRGILLRDILDGLDLTSCDKAYTLTASYNGAIAWNTIERHQRNMVAKPIQVGALPRPNGELSTSQGFRIYSIDGKSVTLKGNAGGAGGKTGLYAVNANGKEERVYEVKDGLITIRDTEYPIKLPDGLYTIRKLSVAECKKLQTVPDWYEFPVSYAQATKQLGNGWTCDVITHIIKGVLDEAGID